MFDPFLVKTCIESRLLTRVKATYNWPCEKTGSGMYKPQKLIVCPCDLLIVMPKAGLIGN